MELEHNNFASKRIIKENLPTQIQSMKTTIQTIDQGYSHIYNTLQTKHTQIENFKENIQQEYTQLQHEIYELQIQE